MHSIKAPAIHIHEGALADADCRVRVERLLSGVHQEAAPETVDDARLNEISAEHN